jgi:hypothetical protein
MKIILSEPDDETGLFDEYHCVSNMTTGYEQSGTKRNYQKRTLVRNISAF